MTEALKVLGFAALMLSVKILTWLSLLGAFSLFLYAMVEPERERTISAALFAALVFLPSLFMERKPRPPTRVHTAAQPQPYGNGGEVAEEQRYG